MMPDVRGVKDGGDIGEGLRSVVTGLIVDDTDAFRAIREGDTVDSVSNAANKNVEWRV